MTPAWGTPAGQAWPWRTWVPDLAVAVVVAIVGLLEVATTDHLYSADSSLALVALGMATAAGLSRHAPGLALGLVWGICAIQLISGTDLMVVQVVIAVVAFGTARWGSLPTVWLSGLSIPAAGLLVLALIAAPQLSGLVDQAGLASMIREAYGYSDPWRAAAAAVGVSVLGVPWLAGLALRFLDRARGARVSQVAAEADAAQAVREREQAQEIARLRDEQTRLARDVHDVVGHSLAVILAQAESAQYLPDDDPARIKATLATIAGSARSSLQDVRQVLSSTRGDATAAARPGGLDQLVEGVRAAGHEVHSTEVGTPRPLPPELETVAFRVLQEMLTNAIRHGRRDSPVRVERHWEGELRIEVANAVAEGVADPPEPPGGDPTRPIAVRDGDAGHGLEGMRRRLEAVGGRLDVRRREEPDGPTFTATAWVPTRGVA